MLNELEVNFLVLSHFFSDRTKKGLIRFGSKFQEMPNLLTNLDVSKRPYPCHKLGRSVCLSQGCPKASLRICNKNSPADHNKLISPQNYGISMILRIAWMGIHVTFRITKLSELILAACAPSQIRPHFLHWVVILSLSGARSAKEPQYSE